MTAKQLRRFLEKHGLSQSAAAREIDIADRTLRRYIADELPVPRAVEFALRWLVSQRSTK